MNARERVLRDALAPMAKIECEEDCDELGLLCLPRRAREALAAADAIPDAPAEPAPLTAERRAELVEVMRSTQVSVRERMGKVLDALIKAGAVK